MAEWRQPDGVIAQCNSACWGIPPTGKQVTIDLIDILRITDDQMVEHWNLVDWMGLMQQLGATPRPGPPGE